MSRQVDIKALVSHIVRGDGLDKCRICMGDTSQGQVHLTDTVMMDGDKAVTLSELLEVVTGVEVVSEEALPPAMCKTCFNSALKAAEFRSLVHRTQLQWTTTIQLLDNVPDHQYNQLSDTIIASLNNNAITITNEYTQPPVKKAKVLIRNNFGKIHDVQCPVCDKKFLHPSLLHKHLKDSGNMLRACHICAVVMSRNELVNHLKNAHHVTPYDCKHCPAMFLNGKQYLEHLFIAHAPGTRTCGECSRSFKNLPSFHAHQSVHARRSCPNCDKQFQSQMCYTHHVKTCCKLDFIKGCSQKKIITLQNKENKKVKMGKRGSTNNTCICDYCNKTFSAKKYVAAHIEIVHTKATHRPCKSCGKIFASAHMSTHMRTHKSPKYGCEYCGVVLKSKLGFEQHLRLHSGERPYECEHCGETFSASSRRSEHMRKTHFKAQIVLKHHCTFCTAKFRLPSKLRLHTRKVHKAKGNKPIHECPQCLEHFVCYRSLQNHIEKH